MWEPEHRTKQEPRTEPEARTETEPRTEPAARTEPETMKTRSVKCPFCGYLLPIDEETEKPIVKCKRCGKVFQAE